LDSSENRCELLKEILMADQTPEPESLPTYEDAEKELGLDAMSFMSEMLRQPESKEE
jgi:hypothetical protein